MCHFAKEERKVLKKEEKGKTKECMRWMEEKKVACGNGV